MNESSSDQNHLTIDAVIAGGGIAGVWLLNILLLKGYNAILLEKNDIGCQQTLASQGMVHGGLKYALSGLLSNESEAIADMPRRWKNCLTTKNGDVDLRNVSFLSDSYYMFSENRTGKLASFFASKALRGRIEKLNEGTRPNCFKYFNGVVYKLNDFVLDTGSLLSELTKHLKNRLFKLDCSEKTVRHVEGGYEISLSDFTIKSKVFINCAGVGTRKILQDLKITDFEIQNRPLKQIIVDAPNQTNMFAHCITNLSSLEPRLTITTHASGSKKVWYIGGQLASQGASLSDEAQIAYAKKELTDCVPWLSWKDANWRVLSIDRAEPLTVNRLKPDEAFAKRSENFIQCFPTKLTLAPDLGDKVLRLMDPPRYHNELQSSHVKATVGEPPWR